MWVVALVALIAEFAIWMAFWVRPAFFRDGVFVALVWLIALPLIARLIVGLACVFLSRWKGVKLTREQRLSPVEWLRFFVVEYGHLCIQNLLLIPFRALFHTRSERGSGPKTGPVILMQHGYVNNGAVWFFTARALEAKGYRVFTIDQPAFAPIDLMGERLAARVDEVLARTDAAQLTLVAHSMGGLVCRAYLRSHGGEKVAQLITMGTPHHGTFHALFANGPNGAQMRLSNTWLAALNQTRVLVPFKSFYSLHDTIIAPQDSSVMAEATNVELHAIGHVSMPSGIVARGALLTALAMAARPTT
jgi:triacylglycerol lipase